MNSILSIKDYKDNVYVSFTLTNLKLHIDTYHVVLSSVLLKPYSMCKLCANISGLLKLNVVGDSTVLWIDLDR